LRNIVVLRPSPLRSAENRFLLARTGATGAGGRSRHPETGSAAGVELRRGSGRSAAAASRADAAGRPLPDRAGGGARSGAAHGRRARPRQRPGRARRTNRRRCGDAWPCGHQQVAVTASCGGRGAPTTRRGSRSCPIRLTRSRGRCGRVTPSRLGRDRAGGRAAAGDRPDARVDVRVDDRGGAGGYVVGRVDRRGARTVRRGVVRRLHLARFRSVTSTQAAASGGGRPARSPIPRGR